MEEGCAVTGMSGSVLVNRLLRVSTGVTPVLVETKVRYLKYPSSRVRSLRRTTVIRKLSISMLIGRVGSFLKRWSS